MANQSWKLISLLICFFPFFLSGCGGSSSNSTSTLNTDTNVTVSGTVTVSDSDASSSALPLKNAKALLSGSTVRLYKMKPDNSEELIDTTTTDSNGSYSFSNVPKAAGGNGSSTDFYYEVRASSGTIDVRAPLAPTEDLTANISPETNVAAKIISDIMDIPTSSTPPTVRPDLINATRKMVDDNVDDLAPKINMPSMSTTANMEMLALANGVASAGGNAEKIFKTLETESEFIWLTTAANNATTAQAAAFLKRVTREACNQPAIQPLPMKTATVLASSLIAGTTYTPTQIVAAYNEVAATDVVESDAIAAFSTLLSSLDNNFSASEANIATISTSEQLAMLVKRDLSASSFSASTPLTTDQMLAFLMAVRGVSNICDLGSPSITNIIAELTGDTSLTLAHFEDVQIYHDSGFGCNQSAPDNDGHFRADISIYTPPGVTVNSISISSTDSTALNSGSVNLVQEGSRWVSKADGICINLGTDVTYTVNASLSTSETVTTTLERNHPLVPEASTTVSGSTTSKDLNNPDVFTVNRPVYTWETPEAKLATISNAPAGSIIKYAYEFSHIDVTDSPIGPISSCASNNATGSLMLYEVNSFMPTVDCDVTACAAASGKTASDLRCRINVQTFLLDDADRILGQAAGHFPVFCVDTNGDGDCAE